MKYKAIFFDRDGTLIHGNPKKRAWLAERASIWSGRPYLASAEKSQTIFNQASLHDEAVDSLEAEKRFWLRYYEALLRMEGVKIKVEARARELMDGLWCSNSSIAYDDVIETLGYFKSRGYKMGVISDTFPSLRRTIEDAGLGAYFQSYTSSSLVGVMKPDPAIRPRWIRLALTPKKAFTWTIMTLNPTARGIWAFYRSISSETGI